MNSDLIKKLADQARDSIPQDHYNVNEWIDQYNERLTKLIINECQQICQQGTITQMSSSGAIEAIKLHFGIND